jgi:hypothetical protein
MVAKKSIKVQSVDTDEDTKIVDEEEQRSIGELLDEYRERQTQTALDDNETVAEDEAKPSDDPKESSDEDIEPEDEDIIRAFSDPSVFDDQDTADAVEEIVAEESDKVLEAEDKEKEALSAPKEPKQGLKAKVKSLLKKWWANPLARYGFISGSVLLIILIALIPVTRYSLLNLAGVRVKASMTVVDKKSERPLANISVSLGDKVQKTNEEGYIEFSDLKLGKSKLKIERRGFATQERDLTLGWGSNPLGTQGLEAVGSQFTFVVVDYLSEQPIAISRATAPGVDAEADNDGKIVITVAEDAVETDTVSVIADEYREEQFQISELSPDQERTIKLIPDRKHVFVSRRSGKYDVYKMNADGTNEEMLLKATGKERDTINVVPHAKDDVVALFSTRDNDRNGDGYLMDGLFIVNVSTGEVVKVARSEQIRIVGWEGDRLVFTQIVEGTSAGNPNRSKVISYHYKETTRQELASGNYFNAVELFDGDVYYAVASYGVPISQAKLFKVAPDSKTPQKLLDEEVWSIYQTSPDTLYFDTSGNEGYELKIGANVASKLNEQPSYEDSKVYVKNPKEDTHAWIDYRDGKGVLLLRVDGEDKQLHGTSGLSYPMYWLDSTHIVYRVQDGRETADYVVSTNGGSPKKLSDVTATGSRSFF